MTILVFLNGITTGLVIRKSEIETLFPGFYIAGNDLSYSDNSIKIKYLDIVDGEEITLLSVDAL